MRILAIDPGESCGWATNSAENCPINKTADSGVWSFKLKRDENFAYKLINFERELINQIKTRDINLVVFERVSGHHAAAVMSHSKFVAIIEVYCTRNGLPFKGYSATELKKFATGNGNAGKLLMIKSAIRKFGYKGNRDDEADAICLLNLAIKDNEIS